MRDCQYWHEGLSDKQRKIWIDKELTSSGIRSGHLGPMFSLLRYSNLCQETLLVDAPIYSEITVKIAQLGECWTDNPEVPRSNPTGRNYFAT